MSTAMDDTKRLKTHTATGGYLFKTIGRKTSYIHIQAAEKAIGKPLPKRAEVHHVNGDPSDNRNLNLVICQDHKYHALLHMRSEALLVAGNANFRLCKICGLFDNPLRMNPAARGQLYHTKCLALESRKRRARIKLQKRQQNEQ